MTRQSIAVLLIEDNPGDVGLVRALLAEAGGEFLLTATDRLASGVDHLARVGADVALLDLSLPDSDGLETFSVLKSRAPDVPVVVLSGLSDETVAMEAVKAGAQDYLTKGQISSGLLIRSLLYAIERHRAEARLREENRTIETINRVGRALSSELDPQKLVQAITDAATELTGARFGAFFHNEVNEHGESYMLYTLAGTPREAFEGFPLPRNTSLFGPTFRGEGNVRIDDVTQDPRYGNNPPYFGMPKGHLPVRSYLAVPVLSRSGEVLGGLFFGHPEPRVFNERAERIVEGIAAQAAIATDNARLYQQAQAAIRLREEFLSIASHELRTPITSVRAHAQALLRRYDRDGNLDPGQVVRGLRAIESQTGRLAHLIAQLLDVTRLEAGKLPLDRAPADLAQLAERIVADLQVWDHQHPITLRASGPLEARIDSVRIEQVLINLLENAAKYSPEGSPIEVELDGTSEGWIELAVRDHGVGVPEEQRGRLFERFFQAHRHAHVGGLGLGLYISRQIVELHDGQLAPEFPEDGGCRFVIRLPIDR